MKKILLLTTLLVSCLLLYTGCEKQYENYEKGTRKAMQVEAKINLHAVYAAQMGYRSANGRYGDTFEAIGFAIISDNQRYSYFLGEDVLEGARYGDELPEDLPLPEASTSSFIIYAIADLDDDDDLDIWRIDNKGAPRQLSNDWN